MSSRTGILCVRGAGKQGLTRWRAVKFYNTAPIFICVQNNYIVLCQVLFFLFFRGAGGIWHGTGQLGKVW